MGLMAYTSVTRGEERLHPEATVGLDPHHHLPRLVRQPGQQLVQLADPLDPLGEAAPRQPGPRLVHHLDVVVALGPIVPHEDHGSSSPRRDPDQPGGAQRRPNGPVLEARHPSSATGNPTNRPGHPLPGGVQAPGGNSAHRPAALPPPSQKPQTAWWTPIRGAPELPTVRNSVSGPRAGRSRAR